MTDIDLLKLAANAAGITLSPCKCGCNQLFDDNGDDPNTEWNPLDDDGDALRLACRMGHKHGLPFALRVAAFLGEEPEQDGDQCAATRRAIVRAAADLELSA